METVYYIEPHGEARIRVAAGSSIKVGGMEIRLPGTHSQNYSTRNYSTQEERLIGLLSLLREDTEIFLDGFEVRREIYAHSLNPQTDLIVEIQGILEEYPKPHAVQILYSYAPLWLPQSGKTRISACLLCKIRHNRLHAILNKLEAKGVSFARWRTRKINKNEKGVKKKVKK